jgi:hypothetical protein
MEVSGAEKLDDLAINRFREVIERHSGPGFDISVNLVDEIDWGHSAKRLGFFNEIL